MKHKLTLTDEELSAIRTCLNDLRNNVLSEFSRNYIIMIANLAVKLEKLLKK